MNNFKNFLCSTAVDSQNCEPTRRRCGDEIRSLATLRTSGTFVFFILMIVLFSYFFFKHLSEKCK